MRTWMLAIGFTAGCVGPVPSPPPGKQDAAVVGPSIDAAVTPDAPTTKFSFFITSTGGPSGGDFRQNAGDANGLAGADAICQTKAAAAVPAAASKQWRAYLSMTGVNARDRLGTGPWFNVNGVMIATSVDNLHDAAANNVNKATALDEKGATVNGAGDTPNVHDILTGSLANGMAAANHCNNWTSSTTATAQVGHHDRMGGGTAPTSWNAAHATSGCSAAAFQGSGGRGSFYCFAMN